MGTYSTGSEGDFTAATSATSNRTIIADVTDSVGEFGLKAYLAG